MTEIPPIGFYPQISFEQYKSWGCLNFHSLEAGRGRSALHVRHAMDTTSEPSSALAMGAAIHACILEPERFDAAKRILPAINKRSSTERDARQAMIDAEPSAIWLEQADADAIETIRANVRAFGLARKISGSKGERELSLRWDIDGVPCRGRIDKVCPAVALVDLKSTRNAGPEEFERMAVSYGYHRQAAWYIDGWKAITGETLPYLIVAVENDAPFAVNCFVLDSDLIECGRRENAETFAMVAPCWKSGVWTGYPERLNTLMAPAWLSRRCGLGG